MTRLEDLIYSLATVIVAYHDSQGIKKLITEKDKTIRLEKTRAKAIEIINTKSPTFEEYLKYLIKECTDDYPLRKPFLHYILNQLMFLSALQSKTNSFSPTLLVACKEEMASLLKDFKRLLTTGKSGTLEVRYCVLPTEETKTSSNKLITLSGLENDAYYGNKFCNSGDLLHDEVLQRLNITTTTPDELITALAHDICSGIQNSLLVPELVVKNLKAEEVVTTTKELLRQKTEEADVQLNKVLELESRKVILEETVAATKEELRLKSEQTETEIREKAATIESLTAQLREVESRATAPSQSAEALALKLAEAEERIKAFEIAQKKQEETTQTQKETISRLENPDLNKRIPGFVPPYSSAFFALTTANLLAQKLKKEGTPTETSSETRTQSQNPRTLSPYSSTIE